MYYKRNITSKETPAFLKWDAMSYIFANGCSSGSGASWEEKGRVKRTESCVLDGTGTHSESSSSSNSSNSNGELTASASINNGGSANAGGSYEGGNSSNNSSNSSTEGVNGSKYIYTKDGSKRGDRCIISDSDLLCKDRS